MLCAESRGDLWAARGVFAQDNCCAARTLILPGGHTHYGGHGGPWQGSRETGGLVPTAQLRSSSSSPDSREMQRKMGLHTPEGGGEGSRETGWLRVRVSGAPTWHRVRVRTHSLGYASGARGWDLG